MAYTTWNEITGAAMFAAAKEIAAIATAQTGKTFWASLSRNSSGMSAYIYIADIIATEEKDGYNQVFAVSNQIRISDHTFNPTFKQGIICAKGKAFNEVLEMVLALT